MTIDLELHFAQRPKSRSSSGPFAQYDIYLYRVPSETRPKIPNGPVARTGNGPRRSTGRVLRWEDDVYPLSPRSVCSPVSTYSLPASMVGEQQRPGQWTLKPYTP